MTIGRPIEYDPDQVVQAAMQAFWAKGYEATSLADLLDATGLSKSSFYQSFGSKKEMFERCLSRYADNLVSTLNARLAASPSPVAFIGGMLTEYASEGARTALPMGCLAMNTASEYGQRDAEFAQWVDACITRVHSVFASAIERGQAMGEITGRQPAGVLATYVMTSRSGLGTMVKAGTPLAVVLGVVDVMLSALRAD